MKTPLCEVLEASNDYWGATPARRAEVCNGVGPESWPQVARDLMDSGILTLGMSFKASADIHDWDWSIDFKQKSMEHFEDSNRRFLRNNLALVRRYTPWWCQMLRMKRRALARTLYVAVKTGGWRHYWKDDQNA